MKEYGIWQTLSWADLAALVRALACGMAQAGLRAGPAPDRGGREPAAAVCLDARGTSPWRGAGYRCYQDAASAEFVFPLNNAEVGFAVVEDQEQVDKLVEIRAQCPQLAHLWYDDPRGLRNYDEPGLQSLDALVEAGRARDRAEPGFFDAEVARTQPSDVAAMFFTSGTTGNPQGRGAHPTSHCSTAPKAGQDFDKLTEREEVLAYMPPAWIGQNIFSLRPVAGPAAYVVNCPESAATVTIDLKEIGPTYYFAPPRIFEGLLTSVTIRMEDAGAIKKWLFKTFMAVARRVGPARMDGKPVSAADRLLWRLGDLCIYGPLRNTLGFSPACGWPTPQARRSGPTCSPSTARSASTSSSSTAPPKPRCSCACKPDHEARADTVGVPVAGVEIKLAESGEILVKSPGLLKEYYKNPAATAEVLTADGWYPHRRRRLRRRRRPPEDHRPSQGRWPAAGRRARRRDVRAQVRGEQAQVLPAHQGGGGPSATGASACAPSSTSTSTRWATGPSAANLPYAGYYRLGAEGPRSTSCCASAWSR